jgi:MtN3 and saliva related transmembrane protein
MLYIELIGYAATVLSVISFVPQVVKSWKTKSTKDVSFQMYSIFTTSQILWLTYGILIHSWPLAIANAIIFSLSLSIFVFKVKHG